MKIISYKLYQHQVGIFLLHAKSKILVFNFVHDRILFLKAQ